MKPELAAEVDRDILGYVREMQQHGPVTAAAVYRFLTNIRRRRVTELDVGERLDYLAATDRKLLECHTEWRQGEFNHYTITADGMDVMDGVLPPPNWGKAR
jgi:hypothetical protein